VKAVLHYRAGPNFRALVESRRDALDTVVIDTADEAGFAREMADADILLHVLAPVTAAVMDLAPRLKLVQKIGVGVDAIDRRHAAGRGIAVCNMPGTNTAAVAEMTLSLIFSCLRRLARLSQETKSGNGWAVSSAIGDAVGELGGRTVGLVGHGAVARRLIPVLQALGASPVVHSRTPTNEARSLSLDDLLMQSDIVSLHLPATAETHGIVDRRRIGLMKPGAVLINTARGNLVDEAALTEALSNGRLSAAGLDVFAQEPPPPDNPLLKLPNVVVTPHVAWLTLETLARSLDVVVENAARLAAGRELLHRVSPPA
jgi:phosphoglycerate dehydrogenase-like enzyme